MTCTNVQWGKRQSCSQKLTHWSKNFLRTFKFIFLTKVHKIWMHDNWNENTSNDFIFLSVYRTLVSADRFFSRSSFSLLLSENWLKCSFWLLVVVVVVVSNIGRFKRKTINAARLSIIKIIILCIYDQYWHQKYVRK